MSDDLILVGVDLNLKVSLPSQSMSAVTTRPPKFPLILSPVPYLLISKGSEEEEEEEVKVTHRDRCKGNCNVQLNLTRGKRKER